jgi:hypothetical protein
MEILRKEYLQSFTLSAKGEKTAKGISERKGKEVKRAIFAKDIEWQVRFKELAEQVAKLSKARRLDAESIAKVKIRIASRSSTALLLREKVADAAPPAATLSPSTSRHRMRDPSLSLPSENNEEEE